MQAFTDLVGTAALPTHAFDVAELTDLTPALDTATAAHDTAEQASGIANSGGTQCHSYFQITCPFGNSAPNSDGPLRLLKDKLRSTPEE